MPPEHRPRPRAFSFQLFIIQRGDGPYLSKSRISKSEHLPVDRVDNLVNHGKPVHLPLFLSGTAVHHDNGGELSVHVKVERVRRGCILGGQDGHEDRRRTERLTQNFGCVRPAGYGSDGDVRKKQA